MLRMLVWLDQPYSVFRLHLIICMLQSLHIINKPCGCFQPWISMGGSARSRTLGSFGDSVLGFFASQNSMPQLHSGYEDGPTLSRSPKHSCGMGGRGREGEWKKEGGEEKDGKKDDRKGDKGGKGG